MEKIVNNITKEEVVCKQCGSSDLSFIDTAILRAEDKNYYYYELYGCQKCGHIVSVPIRQVPTAMAEGLVND